MEKKRSKFVEEYLNGKSVIDIAKKYKISREAVYLHLRKLPDWKEVSKLRKKTKLQRAKDKYETKLPKIMKLRAKGLTSMGVSRKLKIPYYSIKILLKDTQYDNSKEARYERDKEICKKYKAGMTQREIADQYGLSQASISEIIIKWDSQKT